MQRQAVLANAFRKGQRENKNLIFESQIAGRILLFRASEFGLRISFGVRCFGLRISTLNQGLAKLERLKPPEPPSSN